MNKEGIKREESEYWGLGYNLISCGPARTHWEANIQRYQ